MSERSGLSDLDVGVLTALYEQGARSDRPHVKSARALEHLHATTGIPPAYGYQVLCNLGARWMVAIPLVDQVGNFGSLDFDAANPRYTEVRLSPIGDLAVAAERGDAGPVPLGMILGDAHLDGPRPPFNPLAVTTALARAMEDRDISDEDLIRIVGAPSFPSGCTVAGDIDALMRGEPVELQLSARLAREELPDGHGGDRAIVVSALPIGASPAQIAAAIRQRAESRSWHEGHTELEEQTRFPIADVYDATTGGSDGTHTRLVVVLEADATYDTVERFLSSMWGVTRRLRVQLPVPMPSKIRNWNDSEGLTRLRALL